MKYFLDEFDGVNFPVFFRSGAIYFRVEENIVTYFSLANRLYKEDRRVYTEVMNKVVGDFIDKIEYNNQLVKFVKSSR